MPYVKDWFAKLPALAEGGVKTTRMQILHEPAKERMLKPGEHVSSRLDCFAINEIAPVVVFGIRKSKVQILQGPTTVTLAVPTPFIFLARLRKWLIALHFNV